MVNYATAVTNLVSVLKDIILERGLKLIKIETERTAQAGSERYNPRKGIETQIASIDSYPTASPF